MSRKGLKLQRQTRRPVIEEIEPRILYSADLAPGLVDAIASVPAEQRVLESTGEFTNRSTQGVQARHHEIVFVDPATPEYDKLIEDIRGRVGDRDVEVVLLNADKDGIRQITTTLAGRADIDAVHIVSHGADGAVQLGNGRLDFASLLENAAKVKGWGDALTDGADILIYGCDVAASAEGRSLVEALGRLTGADVAASADRTGHADLGGDWDLEFHAGRVETSIVFSQSTILDWHATLPATAAGGETLVNTTTGGTQQIDGAPARAIATSANGSYVVVWSGNGTGDGTGVFAQRFDANGVAQGSELRVNISTTNTQSAPAVGIDASGNFVVAWTTDHTSIGNNEVYARRFAADGTALSGEFQVNTFTTGSQSAPVVGMNASGAFVIAWESNGQDGGGAGVYAQRYNASGVAQASEFRVNVTTAGDQAADSVGLDAAGNFVVTFASSDGSSNGVYMRRYDAAGTALTGADVGVNSTTANEQSWSTLAMDPSGNFVVVWRSVNQDGSSGGIYGQRFNASGVAQGGEFQVNTTTANDQANPAVAMDVDGNFVVAWASSGQDGSGWGIYKREYDADGTANGGEVRVNSTTSNDQRNPWVAMNPDRDFVVAWGGEGTGDGAGVFVQRYSFGLVVDTVNDTVDGTTTSIAALLASRGADGRISLREAILTANATANVGGPDFIRFDIAGAGPHTISLTSILPNITDSVFIDGWSEPDFAGTPVIEILGGGTVANAFNVQAGGAGSTIRGFAISGFSGDAINLYGGNNLIAGNYIGTNAAGSATAAVPNAEASMRIHTGSDNNIIGGITALDRNIHAGNGTGGNPSDNQISLHGGNNLIIGNYIGVAADGTTVIGSTNDGIDVSTGATNNIVGGVNPGEGNLIAGQGGGGVRIQNAATGTLIRGNTIWGNGTGVAVMAGSGHLIQQNSIYGNTNLGIDLVGGTETNFVTANDAPGTWTGTDRDPDTGPNDLKNFPVLATATTNGTSTITITGSLNGTGGRTYRIEFFSNPAADAPSGHGEGRTYLGYVNVTADASGAATISAALSGVAVAVGSSITATTTDATSNATSEFAANIAAVAGNTAPVLADTVVTLNPVSEDAGAPSGAVGTLVNTLVGGVSDADGGALQGIAITAADATNGTWWYSTNNGASWSLLGAPSGVSSRLLAADAGTRIYLQPNADYNGTMASAITFRAWDRTSGGNGGTADTSSNGGATAFSSATDTASLTVSAVNDAPVLADTVVTLNAINEDAGAPAGAVGTLISALVGGAGDVDSGALQGIAITLADSANGTWWYSTNNGASWNALGATSAASARLLAADAGTRIYFRPNADYNGTIATALTFRAWDRSSGANGGTADTSVNGGSTAFSTATDTAGITVTAVDDVPVGVADSYSVNEDATLTVDWWDTQWTRRQQITFDNAARPENLDNFPVLIALGAGDINYGETQNAGEDLRFLDRDGTPLSYEIERWDEAGTSYVWVNVPRVDASSASDYIWMYYGNVSAPAGQNPAGVWTSGLRAVYHLTDGGSAISESTGNLTDAVNNGSADAVGAIGRARSFDSIDDWIDIGSGVSLASSASALTVSAWINTSNLITNSPIVAVSINGGAPQNSRVALERADGGDVRLIIRHDDATANVLDTTTDPLTAGSWYHVVGVVDVANDLMQIYVNGALQVSQATSFTGVQTQASSSDSAAIGSQDDGTSGYWDGLIDEVRLAAEARSGNWINAEHANVTGGFVTLSGAQSAPAAQGVLGNDSDLDSVNLTAVLVSGPGNAAAFTFNADGTFTYMPSADFTGTDTFTYRANDGANNSNLVTVTLIVNPVNDAPVLADTVVTLNSVNEDAGAPSGAVGTLVSALVGGASDVDSGAVKGVAIVDADATNGAWWYSTNNGASWSALSGTSTATSRLLASDANSRIYFQPNANYNGTLATAITFRAWDQTTGANGSTADTSSNGGTTAFSTATDTAGITVNPVNDAPAGLPTITGTVTEDQTLTANTGGIADVDGLGAFGYQWLRNGVAIGGATSSSYTLGDVDVGTQISVQVSYTDGYGTAESLTSAQTAAVANLNDAPAGVPTISGTPTEDQTLTANTAGISDVDGLGAFSYQWLRNGAVIGGATSATYTLGDADIGTQISVRVSYVDAHGTSEGPLTSAQTAPVANVNDPPAGVPTISGTVTEDQTLTAVTGGISDADGLGAFSYQWLRNGVAVGGATSGTYTLGDADVGAQISVQVSYTDAYGAAESVTSAQTAAVANINDVPTGAPTVGGTPTEDQTLTANTAGIADIDGLGALGYQWLRNGVAIGGATSGTYVLGDADVGAQISVRVSYTDGHGTAESLTSAQTAAVANLNDAPVGVPTISGTVTEDQTLTADTAGIGDADGLGAFSYQWLRNGVAIASATASTYTLGDADVGTQISVQVSYTDAHGTSEGPLTSAQTAPVANVNDAPVGVPTIGGTVAEDQTLTANAAGISDADGLGAFNYQWLRNGVAIGGATATTYTLGDADVGTQISVRVSYTDGHGTAETATSAQTAPVANVNDAPSGVPTISGTPTEDQTLTASTAGIADDDGLGAFSYQWLRDGVAIGGATAGTYTLGDIDVGTQISVRVSYTDGHGTGEGPLTSAQTAAVANVNDAPAGLPTISGTVAEDQTLTANTGGIGDADGLGVFSFQWLRDGVAIGGATAGTYTLGETDVGTQISVQVDYTDAHGTAESVTSAQTAPVANVNDVPSGLPTISGTPTEDQTLSAGTAGIGDADGLGAFSYQWLRNGVAIGGATAGTYTLGDADVAAQISVRVSYTDGHGTAETLTSAQTAPVANVNDTPVGLPGISGTVAEDQTLTASTAGIADADGLGAFGYQWLRDGVAIGGATASTYVLGDADVGAQISVQVSYTDAQGTSEGPLTSAQSAPVANVNDPPAGAPTISGTAAEDQILTADTAGISDADGLGAFSYQWLRDGTAIGGATAGTYTLGDTDVGTQISVQVSYIDGYGSAETVTSAQTAAVANVNDAPTGVPTITGTPTEDQALTASTAGIADADGLGAFGYQWLRDGVVIGGANASTYTLTDTDVGTQISVQVSYTDGHGTAESVVSAQTAPVANLNDPPTGAVSIAGIATEDQTLTADTSTLADADGLGALSYQWLRNGVAIGGATANTYMLGDADVGALMQVRVSYTDGDGSAESLTSASLGPVANVNDAPLLGANSLTIGQGGRLVLSAANLSASDLDDAAGTLVFTVSNLSGGRFELAGAPGVAIAGFTQADVAAGVVVFVHDGSPVAPGYAVTVSDGGLNDGPRAASVSFVPSVVLVDVPVPVPPAPPPEAPPELKPAPEVERPAVIPAAVRPALHSPGRVDPPEAQLNEFSFQALGSQRLIRPVATLNHFTTGPYVDPALQLLAAAPANLQYLRSVPADWSVRPAFPDAEDTPLDRIDVLLDQVQVGGMALSVGVVWWASRISGLLGSLLASAPAWRHIDPLPVVGRDEDEDKKWYDPEDREADANELAVAHVLEGAHAAEESRQA